MNLRRMFRRARPTPAPQRIDPGELTIISWYDLTPEQWAALPNHRRTEYRDFYMKVKMP